MKTEGYALLGQHESTILGLGFQGTPFAGRRPTAASTDHTLAAGDVKTVERNNKLNHGTQARETTADTLATAEMTLAREGTPSPPLDRERMRSRGTERATTKGGVEEEGGALGLVLLSASMDGSVRAWETLGKSEKYCMRHPATEEVTTMLVLPGGSVLVTGEKRAVATAGLLGCVAAIAVCFNRVTFARDTDFIFENVVGLTCVFTVLPFRRGS